ARAVVRVDVVHSRRCHVHHHFAWAWGWHVHVSQFQHFGDTGLSYQHCLGHVRTSQERTSCCLAPTPAHSRMFRRPGTINTVIDLETLAFVNYGHFTAMPVFPEGVRGLRLHLERLDRDARILFGHGIDGSEVIRSVVAALEGRELPANVRVTAFVPNIPL